jgi:hypothetical protein
MEHKLVKTGNYLLVVSDEKIKEGELYYLESVTTNNMILKASESKSSTNCKKIIAHLPLNNSPYLEGVDVLPPLEDEVENLANEFVKEVQVASDSINRSIKLGYEEGYNKAKEKYKYTEEDVVKLIHSWDMHINQKEEDKGCLRLIYEHIQSLNQPTLPIAFECEMEQLNNKHGSSYSTKTLYKPKTITNSQGRTEWVGEYKF